MGWNNLQCHETGKQEAGERQHSLCQAPVPLLQEKTVEKIAPPPLYCKGCRKPMTR